MNQKNQNPLPTKIMHRSRNYFQPVTFSNNGNQYESFNKYLRTPKDKEEPCFPNLFGEGSAYFIEFDDSSCHKWSMNLYLKNLDTNSGAAVNSNLHSSETLNKKRNNSINEKYLSEIDHNFQTVNNSKNRRESDLIKKQKVFFYSAPSFSRFWNELQSMKRESFKQHFVSKNNKSFNFNSFKYFA
jgi:hypothetical protein